MPKESPSKKQVVTNPHDQFFREAMQDKRVAREFLEHHLPAELSALVDFNHLELQPRSQSNAVRRESIVDLLFKTTIAGKEAYLYLLLEHQSSPDPIMSFRVLEYTVNVIREHLKKYNTQKIPLVIPLVIYHGHPYDFKRDINDLVDAPKALVDRYFLKPFLLIDLNDIQDEELKQHMWSGVMEFALKHVFARDMLPFLRDFTPIFKELIHQGGESLIGIVLQYAIETGEISDNDALIELINTDISYEIGDKVMNAVEKWRKEGELRGMIEGKIDLIKTMLSNGVDPVFIAKNTGVALEEIKALQNKSSD